MEITQFQLEQDSLRAHISWVTSQVLIGYFHATAWPLQAGTEVESRTFQPSQVIPVFIWPGTEKKAE